MSLPDSVSGRTSLSIVYRLTEELDQAASLEEMFEAAMSAVVEAAAVDRASLLLLDSADRMRFVASRGLSREYRRAADGHSPWPANERNPQPVYVRDVRDNEELAAFREVFAAEGIRALAFLPLTRSGRLLGKFMLYANQPTDWDDEELALARNIARQVAFAVDRTRSEQELRSTLAQIDALAGNVPLGLLFETDDGTVEMANVEFSRIFSLSPPRELAGQACREVLQLAADQFLEPERVTDEVQVRREQRVPAPKYAIHLKDGRIIEQTYVPIDEPGALGHLWTYEDVTERLHLERQLHHVQKMESLGAFAAGIAHDFNNLLQSMLTSASLLRPELKPGGAGDELLSHLIQVAREASEVSSRLVTFGQGQPGTTALIDLDESLSASMGFFERLMGTGIDLQYRCDTPDAHVNADAQIQQVVMNLLGNARDATPDGGSISIRVLRTEDSPTGSGVPQIVVSVRDSGEGMSEAVRARVFEPFFSTKVAGRGTGLGLASSYGIIRRFGGTMTVDSTPGAGSEFRVYLPQCERPLDREQAAAPTPDRAAGTARVLLADDEPDVLRVVALALRARGYEVQEAGGGPEALDWMERADPPFDILVTDATMAHVDGHALARRASARRPRVPVILMSGLPDQTERPPGQAEYLQKPFLPDELIARIESVLRDPL
ncbi:MAG: hypothetical protein DHS20C21_10370 [Gemmatimonadota bacterium]|nr:MAG: hypothetical protein DHS20C21_10370 [Gemmatimonadota bacterium]